MVWSNSSLFCSNRSLVWSILSLVGSVLSLVCSYPSLVWFDQEKSLSFLQEASDRVETEDEDSVLIHHLERGQEEVLTGDWVSALDPIVR